MTTTAPLFRSDLQEQVLREIFRSSSALTSSDIARRLGEPVSSVSREVRSLMAAGVLTGRRAGRRILVSFDESSPYVPGLQMMLGATATGRFRPSSPLAWVVARHRSRLRELAATHGLLRLRLVGSVARNEDRPDSDVDLLVDVPRGRSFADLGAFAADAEDLLGVPVDIINSRAVRPEVAETISREAVEL
ncbi:nucleotidyltransferase domain-containing protein [Isoptericola sp. 178]|uniref:nucleotidyltransferase domain-containing protein n=1 Tax=Isoptericola sp. 178 TaxID=3064651 RepID=UPI0027126445|nr:nucleotidyltransferase domain-containing protein [Isoptericola sp. 178]MDO8142979.1 nucleotidyltransferase domain-containing protein [Isoptericola sp. 178]